MIFFCFDDKILCFSISRSKNTNKIKRRFGSTKAAFWKNKTAFGFSQTPFCFFEDFCSNRASGELWFLKVKPWFADCGYGTKKKQSAGLSCRLFFFVLRCVIRLFCPDILLGLLPSILLRLSSLLL